MTCESCLFFFKAEDKESYACRFDPPTVVNMMTPRGPITIGQWPPTRPENWCGKHQPAPSQAVQ
jgi:hypothetical protein